MECLCIVACRAPLRKRIAERGDGMGMTLGGKREKPHFAHNTWRHMAAAEAEAAYARGECTAEEIDLHFG